MPNAIAVDVGPRERIMDFMSGFSLETTPGSAAKIPDYRAHVRPGTSIFVTCLQGSDFSDTLALARRLRGEGFNPVPHVAARNIPSRACFEESLDVLTGELGVKAVLCIAGGAHAPRGPFGDTMQLLETGLFDRYGISQIGVAGHPEGNPDIPDELIASALAWKNDFARRTGASMHLVTQFCFEAERIIAWDRCIQAEGSRLPILVGIPGLATVRTLLKHAQACGIGPSMRFVARQAMNVARLMTVSVPDKLVSALAAYKACDPRCGIVGAHLYPLGGLAKTADWAYAVVDGRFRPKDEGFDVP